MRCRDCRKQAKELDSWWDRVRLWFFYKFKNDIFDLSNDKFTEGYGEGYKAGLEQGGSLTQEYIKTFLK